MLISLVHPYRKQATPKGHICLSAALPARLTRSGIIGELVRLNLIPEQMKNGRLLTLNPRNYFIDVLLNKDMELYYDEDELQNQSEINRKRLIKLPYSFQLLDL